MNSTSQNPHEFDHLLSNQSQLEQALVDYLYGEMPADTAKRFVAWSKKHPDVYKKLKELRVTKDILQTEETPDPGGMILPSFYKLEHPAKKWVNRLKPIIQAAAIIFVFFSAAILMDVQILWDKNDNAITIQFGKKTTKELSNEDRIEQEVQRLVAEQLPAISYAVQQVVSDELQSALTQREQHFADLLKATVQNQDVVYQNMLTQITQQLSEQRRSDLIRIMQELDNTRNQSSLEIARNRQVLNNLIQYASGPSESVNE